MAQKYTKNISKTVKQKSVLNQLRHIQRVRTSDFMKCLSTKSTFYQ